MKLGIRMCLVVVLAITLCPAIIQSADSQWKNAKICVRIQENCKGVPTGILKPRVEELLKHVGFEVAHDNTCETTLDIELSCRTLSTEYGSTPFQPKGTGTELATGCSVSGQISIRMRAKSMEVTKGFNGSVQPPDSVKTPEVGSGPNTPYRLVSRALSAAEFYTRLAEVLEGAYGKDVALDYWIATLSYDDCLLESEDGFVRIGKTAVSPLLNALNSERTDKEARAYIPWILSKLKPPAVDALISLLKSRYGDVRENAAKALGQRRVEQAIGPLVIAMQGETADLRQSIAQALARITGQSFGSDYEAWAKWWQAQTKKKE